MSDKHEIIKKALMGPQNQQSVFVTLGNMRDPARRPEFLRLLGIVRTTDEEQHNKGNEESSAPRASAERSEQDSLATGTDQPEA